MAESSSAKDARICELEKQLREKEGYVPRAEFDKVAAQCKELESKNEDAVSDVETLRAASKEREEQLQIQIEAKLKLHEDISYVQSELNGLRMDYDKLVNDIEVVEKDLIAPLGFSTSESSLEEKEVYWRAGVVAERLITGARAICDAIGLEGSALWRVPKLANELQMIPEYILDKQRSSPRFAARTALALVNASYPDLDLEAATYGAPADCDEETVYAQVQGLEERIINMFDHTINYPRLAMTPLNVARARALKQREEQAHHQAVVAAGEVAENLMASEAGDAAELPEAPAEQVLVDPGNEEHEDSAGSTSSPPKKFDPQPSAPKA